MMSDSRTSAVRQLVVHRRMHMPHWLRLSRYVIGSVICFGVSELVFIATFYPHLLGARSAAFVGFIAGTLPGYFLNRSWTWGRTGRSSFVKEIAPYWIVAIVSAVLIGLGTGGINTLFLHESRTVRTLINAVGYMVVNGVLFVGKYLLFHKVLFGRQPSTAPPAESIETSTIT